MTLQILSVVLHFVACILVTIVDEAAEKDGETFAVAAVLFTAVFVTASALQFLG